MRPGEPPRVLTGTGVSTTLDGPSGFEDAVQSLLEHVFLLDCVTRTEGLYPVDLRERETLERRVDVDVASLYERPPGERLAGYLEVPREAVADLVPARRLVTYVEPTAAAAEVLPFVVNDLAVVRTTTSTDRPAVANQRRAVDEFLLGDERFGDADPPGEPETARDGGPSPGADLSVEQERTDRRESVSTNEATLSAFYNRLDREPQTGPIDVTVICNDASMDAERRDVVEEVYGTREDLPLRVSLERSLTTADLRETLAESRDFLHYIGHIDGEGFACTDGRLDARTLDEVGVDAFLLNACRSYRQGRALVQRGSIGGVVTHSDVVNRGAVAVGSALARLLNRGFPLRAVLSVASDASVIGNQYVVVGDGGSPSPSRTVRRTAVRSRASTKTPSR
ncbi:MAG: hypothetical protein ABEJ42_09240 [Halobacteriaceae archaeon]